MRYRIIYIVQLVLLFIPVFVFAQTNTCSPVGYTILTINGIWTNKEEAAENSSRLFRRLDKTYNRESVTIDYLHNPSHLAGLGDIVKTIEQGLFDTETVDDYDLVEMLRAASEKVKTRKLLIVGHSQGNFYANAFYKRATAPSSDGASVPLESIGVYSVATPSSYVAGDGEYITSETDKAIAGIVGRVLRKDILPTNTRIEEVANDTGLTAGHSFSDVYLKYRGAEIVGGIEKSLYKLTPKHTNILQNVGMLEDATSPCIAAPERTLAHKAAGLAFAVADPAAAGAKLAVVGAVKGVNAVGLAVGIELPVKYDFGERASCSSLLG